MAENHIKKCILSLFAAAMICNVRAAEPAPGEKIEVRPWLQTKQEISAGKSSFRIGGYAKTDLILSDFKDGVLSSDSLGRDLYIPATLPAGGTSNRYTDIHAKESRVNFDAVHFLGNGARLRAFLEVDLLRADHDTSRPRLRHAFVQYGNWTMGQTWTTLFNVNALPENLDFIGPSESTIFRRQAMIRYSRGPWQLALENPRTTLTPFGGGARIEVDEIRTPDAVLRYNFDGQRGSYAIAGILRKLGYQDSASGSDMDTTAYGISLSGKIRAGAADDFRWMASFGKGLGHYIGLNTASGAVIDENGQLETISSAGLFGSYRHVWNDRWRSNFTLGYLAVDNDPALTGDQVTRNASSMHLNLIYSPRSWLDFGVEYLLARREPENDKSGTLNRLQFSAKFSYFAGG